MVGELSEVPEFYNEGRCADGCFQFGLKMSVSEIHLVRKPSFLKHWYDSKLLLNSVFVCESAAGIC